MKKKKIIGVSLVARKSWIKFKWSTKK